MDKQGSRKIFEEWLQAYCDRLHLVRQGPRLDLVKPEAGIGSSGHRVIGSSEKPKPTKSL